RLAHAALGNAPAGAAGGPGVSLDPPRPRVGRARGRGGRRRPPALGGPPPAAGRVARAGRAPPRARPVPGRSAPGPPTLGVAAPGWRCTPASLAAVDEAGFAYRSDTRGSYPYRPAAAGRVFEIPEIPTTLPTLDETYGDVSRDPAQLADYYARLLRPDVLNV